MGADRVWRLSLATGEDFEAEFRTRRAGGAHLWFLTRGKPVRDHHGAIARWVGSCTDMDESGATRFMVKEF